MELCTGVSAFTRGGGGKTGFASHPARYYVVSLNGQPLLLFLSTFLPLGLSSAEPLSWLHLTQGWVGLRPGAPPAACGHGISPTSKVVPPVSHLPWPVPEVSVINS